MNLLPASHSGAASVPPGMGELEQPSLSPGQDDPNLRKAQGAEQRWQLQTECLHCSLSWSHSSDGNFQMLEMSPCMQP